MSQNPPPDNGDAGAAESPPGFWCVFRRRCWRGVRWCTRIGYVVLALVSYALFHLHQIGLPTFLKERLITELSAQGLVLDFSRLRLLFLQGVVADDVTLRLVGAPEKQNAFFRQVSLSFDQAPLLSGELPRLQALGLSGGEVILPVQGGSGLPSALLQVKEVAGQLEFPGQDEWRLVGLSGKLNQVSIESMGTVRGLKRFLGRSKPGDSSTPFRSRTLVDVLNGLDAMQYREQPRIELVFSVDGNTLERSFLQFRFSTAGASSPHGEFEGVRLSLGLRPEPGEEGRLHGSVRLDSDAVRTRWGEFDLLKADAELKLRGTNFLPEHAEWNLRSRRIRHEDLRFSEIRVHGITGSTNGPGAGDATEPVAGLLTRLDMAVADFTAGWGGASRAGFEGTVWNPGLKWNPRAVDGELRLGRTRMRELGLDSLALRGGLVSLEPAERPALGGFWTSLAPLRFRAEAAATRVSLTNDVLLQSLSVGADWRTGRLDVGRLDLRLPGGRIEGSVSVDAVSRAALAALKGETTLAEVARRLPADWWRMATNQGIHPENRLAFDLNARGELPPWDTPSTNWPARLRSALAVSGGLSGDRIDLGGVVVDRLEARFGGAAERLTLESLRVVKAPGELNLRGEFDAADGHFEAQVDSNIDPLAFRPLIRGAGLGRQLDMVTLDFAPRIEAEVHGNVKVPGGPGFQASVAITNATYRGEPVTELRTTLDFTNRALVFAGTEIRQGDRVARAPYMRYDLQTQLLYITNALASIPLDSVGRIIGPKTARVLSLYQFPDAPTVGLTGYIPITSEARADVVFQARAPRFEWWYFRFTNLLATVGWKGDQLTISNMSAGFYGGVMSASVQLDFSNNQDTVFSADATYADVDVTSLMSDLVTRTNELGGVLTGQLIIREGHGRRGPPWRGEGNSQIRNGVLWGLPLFGMLSPVFDSIAPGMGQAKFNAGNAFFALTNNAVDFSRIELLSSAMRIDMKGLVDFDGGLDLLLEARPLRGVPLLGAVLDLVLSPFAKLFEYEVRGTLGEPTAELKNVPSFLLAPLRPFKTLKTIFTGPELKPKPEPLAPAPEPRQP